MSEAPKTIALRIIEDLWNKKNPTLIDAMYATSCIIHTPAGEMHGLAGARQLYDGYTTAFPDAHFTIEDVVAEGDTVVIRYTFAGTHRGTLRGIPPRANRRQWQGWCSCALRRGK